MGLCEMDQFGLIAIALCVHLLAYLRVDTLVCWGLVNKQTGNVSVSVIDS